jgi:hypothetical protein
MLEALFQVQPTEALDEFFSGGENRGDTPFVCSISYSGSAKRR